jgi:hypothetical protein
LPEAPVTACVTVALFATVPVSVPGTTIGVLELRISVPAPGPFRSAEYHAASEAKSTPPDPATPSVSMTQANSVGMRGV